VPFYDQRALARLSQLQRCNPSAARTVAQVIDDLIGGGGPHGGLEVDADSRVASAAGGGR